MPVGERAFAGRSTGVLGEGSGGRSSRSSSPQTNAKTRPREHTNDDGRRGARRDQHPRPFVCSGGRLGFGARAFAGRSANVLGRESVRQTRLGARRCAGDIVPARFAPLMPRTLCSGCGIFIANVTDLRCGGLPSSSLCRACTRRGGGRAGSVPSLPASVPQTSLGIDALPRPWAGRS